MTNTSSPQPEPKPSHWADGAAYERYVGRWSRVVARQFLAWLSAAPDGRWLDVGCGTGALSQTILQQAAPRTVHGVDRSEAFVALAKQQVADARARFESGDAQALPAETAAYDAVVSGLMLTFVPQPERAAAEMARAARPGAVVAVYVWDYSEMMQMLRHFWDAASALDPAAAALDEGRRISVCQPEPLAAIWRGAGLQAVEVTALDIDTHFTDFEDYWAPFLGGQGPAPAYAMGLNEERRAALRERLRAALPFAADGSVPLVARAWAVRGVR